MLMVTIWALHLQAEKQDMEGIFYKSREPQVFGHLFLCYVFIVP